MTDMNTNTTTTSIPAPAPTNRLASILAEKQRQAAAAATSASSTAVITEQSQSNNNNNNNPLTIYYCNYCNTYCLLSSFNDLSLLPQRQTDESYIINSNNGYRYKYFLTEPNTAPPIAIKRTAGIELQWRMNCLNCLLPIAYVTIDPIVNNNNSKKNPLLYIINNALVKQKEEEDINISIT